MKQKYYLLSFLLLFALGGLSAQSEPTQMKKAKNIYWARASVFTHRVKSYISGGGTLQNVLEYDNTGRLIKNTLHELNIEYDKDGNVVAKKLGKVQSWRKYLYDENGYVAEIRDCRSPQKAAFGEVVTDRLSFNRDANGYIQYYEHQVLDSSNPDASIDELVNFQKTEYTYDSEGRLIACRNYGYVPQNEDWTLLKTCGLSYNNKGLPEEMVWKSGDTDLLNEVYFYNDEDQLVRVIYTNEPPARDKLTFEYEYDENGNIVSFGRDEFPYKAEYDLTLNNKTTFVPIEEFGTPSALKYLDACTNFRQIPAGMTENAVKKINSVQNINEPIADIEVEYEKNDVDPKTDAIDAPFVNFSVAVGKEFITVTHDDALLNPTLKVYTTMGELVKTQKMGNGEISISRSELPQGVLLISLAHRVVKIFN